MLLALTVAATFAPAAALELRRPEVVAGEPWRVLTCHWVHWSADHLTWDALTLLALAWACRRQPGRAWAAIATASVAIPAAIWLLQPQLHTYRGLSGLASTLFALAATALWRERRSPAGLALLALFAAKLAWEALTGTTLFADAAEAGFVPAPLAHLVGGACGLVAALAGRAPGNPQTLSPCQHRDPQAPLHASSTLRIWA